MGLTSIHSQGLLETLPTGSSQKKAVGMGGGGWEQLPGHSHLVAASGVEVLVLLLQGGDLLLQQQVFFFL